MKWLFGIFLCIVIKTWVTVLFLQVLHFEALLPFSPIGVHSKHCIWVQVLCFFKDKFLFPLKIISCCLMFLHRGQPIQAQSCDLHSPSSGRVIYPSPSYTPGNPGFHYDPVQYPHFVGSHTDFRTHHGFS